MATALGVGEQPLYTENQRMVKSRCRTLQVPIASFGLVLGALAEGCLLGPLSSRAWRAFLPELNLGSPELCTRGTREIP